MTGHVKRWTDRGFGFIKSDDGIEYFCHISKVSGEFRELQENTQVSFDSEKTEKGFQAINVVVI